MKTLLLSMCIGLLSISGMAQQTFTVLAKGETTLEGSLPKEMMYTFPNYRPAKIVNKNGSENNTRININLYTGDVLFLTSANQILVLAYPLDVEHIMIEDTAWVQIDGIFWQVKSSKSEVNLVAAKKTRITNTKKEAGYGGTSGTSSVGRVSQMTMNGNQIYTPLPVGEYEFRTSKEFMLVKDSKSAFATKSAFKKFFPEEKKKIDEYLKTNDVDFQNETDLMSFLDVVRKM